MNQDTHAIRMRSRAKSRPAPAALAPRAARPRQ